MMAHVPPSIRRCEKGALTMPLLMAHVPPNLACVRTLGALRDLACLCHLAAVPLLTASPNRGGRQNSTVRGHVCCVRRGSCLVRQIRRRPPVATDPRRSGVLQHVLFGFPRRAAECVRSSTSSTRTGSVPSWIRCPWCSRPPAWCMDGVLGSRMP